METTDEPGVTFVAGSARSALEFLPPDRATSWSLAFLLGIHLAAFSSAALADSACTEPSPTPMCPHVLVEFRQALSAQSRDPTIPWTLLSVLKDFGVTDITVGVGSLPNVLVLTVQEDTLTSPDRLGRLRTKLQQLGNQPQLGRLLNFEPSIYWAPRTVTPNDPRYCSQTSVLQEIHAPAAWERITKIPITPTLVAVIDTGMRYEHLDLLDQMWPGEPLSHGRNFSGGPSNDTHDRLGHGTNVAGVLAATSNNYEGLASIPWRNNVQLVIAKYLDKDHGGCTENLLDSIHYAANVANASIVNLSVGQDQCSVTLRNELQLIRDRKPHTLLVAAVANTDTDPPPNLDAPNAPAQDYPTSYHLTNVVSVQAANDYGGLFESAVGERSVHLAAPGADVQTTGHLSDTDYLSAPGTSLAAPQVSATAALISAYAPQWRHEQIRQYLVDSARNPACGLPGAPPPDDYSLCGKSQSGGVLNVDAATGAPVVIEQPFQGERWNPGSRHKVRWHRLFTTALCPDLDLFLSIDNGTKWTALRSKPSTPQTRNISATVMLPSGLGETDSARIAVRCHGTAHLERWSDPFIVD